MFYTGDRFPEWKGNIFVGSMFEGRTRAPAHAAIVLQRQGAADSARTGATELHQRIRDVQQGPDGLLYLFTDEDPGALLKIEPAP